MYWLWLLHCFRSLDFGSEQINKLNFLNLIVVILMKFVIRPYHIMSLGGYIVEYDFPYRDLIIVNETAEDIKFEIPVFDGSYIEEYEKLGLKVIPVNEHDSYLNLYKKAHAELDALKAKLD